ncbi:hypothetical protein MXB_463 [Myxobolus squamalis]|nr:hypothetical protein MXB_463 [Myxobolus squamalis]
MLYKYNARLSTDLNVAHYPIGFIVEISSQTSHILPNIYDQLDLPSRRKTILLTCFRLDFSNHIGTFIQKGQNHTSSGFSVLALGLTILDGIL